MAIDLLITSDDFGMSHSVNQAIIDAGRDNIIGSSNIMVPTPWAFEAAQLSQNHNFPVGIHLTLTCEWDHYLWRPLTGARSLTSSRGAFPQSVKELFAMANEEEVFKELNAQFELLKHWGVDITHIDSHMIPSQPRGEAEQWANQLIQNFAADKNLPYTYHTVKGQPRYFDGEIRLSELDDDTAWNQLQNILNKSGRYHLICHLSEDSLEQESIAPNHPWSRQKRVKDLQFLRSDRFQNWLKDSNVNLVSISEL